ncbi:MAG: hypothetical protein ACYSWU_29760 [Planctomycetota bacterium]
MQWLHSSTIPWWLAEIAYEHYVALYGKSQTLERIGQRGGFGRDELVAYLRREKPGKSREAVTA